MPPELKRAVQAAIAESNRYTDQKFADHIRENTVGGLLMAIAFFVALEVFIENQTQSKQPDRCQRLRLSKSG